MNILISVFGRFHAFDLARELSANNNSVSLHTSYPRSQVFKHIHPSSLNSIHSSVHFEIINRIQRRIPFKSVSIKLNRFVKDLLTDQHHSTFLVLMPLLGGVVLLGEHCRLVFEISLLFLNVVAAI